MVTKTAMIFRDVLYAIVIVLLLLPTNPIDMSMPVRILLIAIAVAQRVWQHMTYYKVTGKIY